MNVRALLTALDQAGKLDSFHTTVAAQKSDWYMGILPQRIRQELLRRSYDLPDTKISTYPLRELVRVSASKLGMRSITTHETGWASIDSVSQNLDRQIAMDLARTSVKNLPAGVYCYEDAALHTFQAAKQLGLKCFYDLPIGYWRVGQNIQREEAALKPEWAPTLTANFDSPEKLARKDKELQLADVVFVASSFTRQTLMEAPELNAAIKVTSYGSPLSLSENIRFNRSPSKLRVLFVGSLGQRKGISYLLDAVNQVDGLIELTLIGQPTGICRPLEQALKAHRWIPSLSHQRILEEMNCHDIFVFPSLFEGFGLVILEAMSQGLPAITTPHTAGPDIITEGKDGFIVPIRSSEAIAEKIAWFADHRTDLTEMGRLAQQKAQSKTWQHYSEAILGAIESELSC